MTDNTNSNITSIVSHWLSVQMNGSHTSAFACSLHISFVTYETALQSFLCSLCVIVVSLYIHSSSAAA